MVADEDPFTAMISDLAYVFHWTEDDCLKLDIQDFFAYHENAVTMFEKINQSMFKM
ncbi:hypothetical protein [Candidatus Albibeggiatoa sp. nov. BB20]|uniref:hypothetical protein n=1 Tax=Candidatus Albibeggiatoa sp. nov. BB20 TaxID=3162723 RepID=UPI0033655E82